MSTHSLALIAKAISAGRTAAEGALRGRRAQRRLIVLDPGLATPGGHHFEFARLLRSQFAGARKVTFYVHATAGPLVAMALNARPLFKDSIYPRNHGAPFTQTYSTMARSMAHALKAVDSDDLRADTIAMMHTTTIFALGALAEWYGSLAPRLRPKLFVQFQHPLEFMVEPAEQWPNAIRFAKEAATALAAAGFVRFAANSQTLGERIEAQLDQPCALMPVPVRWPNLPSIEPERGVVFGFFGGLRLEKGAHILAAAIESFTARYPDARFIVHAPPGSDLETVRALKRIPQVELLRRSFTRKADYYAALRRARWILLPYDPAAYAIRTSGVFIEALGLGVPVVVTAGTWMANELRSQGALGLIVPEYRASALSDCLSEARRVMLAGDGAPPIPIRTVMTEHSPAGFCSALLSLMESKA